MAIVLPSEVTFSVLRSSKIPQQKSGTGKIEITGNGVFLKTGGERIPLEGSDTATLHDGQDVRYSVKNDSVQITSLPPGSPSASPVSGDLLSLTGTNTAATEAATAVQPSTSLPVENLQPGLYLLKSFDDLKMPGIVDLTAETKQLVESELAADGAVVLRVTTDGNGVSKAVVWSLADIPMALQQLSSSFSGPLMASFPIDLLARVLVDRGNLPFAPLLQLDRLMTADNAGFPPMRAGNVDAQKNALQQWMHTALLFEVPEDDIAALAPVAGAGTMMAELEPVLAPVLEGTGISLPVDGFTSMPGVPETQKRGEDTLFSQAVNRIGFTLEQVFAAPDATTRDVLPQQTLKSLLLHLIARFPPADESRPAANEALRNNEPVTGRPQVPESSSLPPATQQAQRPPADTALKMLADLHTVITDIGRSLPHKSTDADPSSPLPAVPGEKERSPAVSGNGPGRSASASDTIPPDRRLSELPGLISRVLKIIEPMKSAFEPGPQPVRGAAERLADVLAVLARTVEELPPAAQPGGNAMRIPVSAQPVPQFPDTFPPLVRAVLKALDTLIFELQQPVDAASGPHGGPREEALQRERAAISQHSGTEELPQDTLQHRQLARALSTALDRLESLQLLARQVPTAQGTQQIIALPIRFGEAWTEINVRFLHRKKRNGNKPGRTAVSVAVDIAPPSLGAIHANLDYRPVRTLSCSIDFERKSTQAWFMRHRDEFRRALRLAGMSAVQIDMRTSRRPPAASDDAAPATGLTLFDLKA